MSKRVSSALISILRIKKCRMEPGLESREAGGKHLIFDTKMAIDKANIMKSKIYFY